MIVSDEDKCLRDSEGAISEGAISKVMKIL